MDTVEKILQDHSIRACSSDLLQQRINALLEKLLQQAEDARKRHYSIKSSQSKYLWMEAEDTYWLAQRKLDWLTTII